MPDYSATDLQDVFVYTMIDEYIKNSKHFCPIRCSATGVAAKLSDAEFLFLFVKRRHIESGISRLENLFPKKIHIVIQNGFLLNILGFFLANQFLFFL